MSNMSNRQTKLSRRAFMASGGVAAASVATAQIATAKSQQLPHIRSADSQSFVPFAPSELPTPSLAVIALNRIGFGPKRGDIAAFNALGATDEERLIAYVDQQLDPGAINDNECDVLIAFGNFTTIDATTEQLWQKYVRYDDETSPVVPRNELWRLTFIRAINSKRQLLEVLVDFWHNHFSVYGSQGVIGSLLPRYDREVIRPNALGNFRQMLEAVAKSTCMLYYLDNYTNSNAGPNENFARELFELHTLGAENYLGSDKWQSEIDGYPDEPVGYVDNDVYEAIRCFTGWAISNNTTSEKIGDTGNFYYRAEWHDRFQKMVLGQLIPPDQEPLKDGLDVLDILASHPGTARYISRKLCRRLVSDFPPESLVQSAADIFHANVNAPDQIAQVVRHIVLSNAFRTTWGEKTKRPFEFTVSATRAMGGYPIAVGLNYSDAYISRYSSMGQILFNWPAPNGYPDMAGYWLNSNMLYEAWRTVNWLVDIATDDGNQLIDLLSQMPQGIQTSRQIVDFWVDRLLGRTLPDNEYKELLSFMKQGRGVDFDLDMTDVKTQDRVRSLVALIFCLPSQQWR